MTGTRPQAIALAPIKPEEEPTNQSLKKVYSPPAQQPPSPNNFSNKQPSTGPMISTEKRRRRPKQSTCSTVAQRLKETLQPKKQSTCSIVTREVTANITAPLTMFGVNFVIVLLTMKYQAFAEFMISTMSPDNSSTSIPMNISNGLAVRGLSASFSGWGTCADQIKNRWARYSIKTTCFTAAVALACVLDNAILRNNPENDDPMIPVWSAYLVSSTIEIGAKLLESGVTQLFNKLGCGLFGPKKKPAGPLHEALLKNITVARNTPGRTTSD